MVGVLGGLIFVGLEMRLSRNIALASQIQARSNQGLSHMDTYIEAGIDWLGVAYPETLTQYEICLLYTSPSPRDRTRSRMPSSA